MVIRNSDETTEERVITHQSIGVMIFVHQVIGAAPLCHLYGRGCIKFSGCAGDGGDAGGPGLVPVTWRIRTPAVVWLAL